MKNSVNCHGKVMEFYYQDFCVAAELKLTYLKKPYFVTVGMFHMSLLLPFNNSDSLTFKDLLETSQLPIKELVKHLQALRETKVITTEV